MIPFSEFKEIPTDEIEAYKDKVSSRLFLNMNVNHYINKCDYVIEKALSSGFLDFDKIKLDEKMQSLIESRIYNFERKTKRKVVRN